MGVFSILPYNIIYTESLNHETAFHVARTFLVISTIIIIHNDFADRSKMAPKIKHPNVVTKLSGTPDNIVYISISVEANTEIKQSDNVSDGGKKKIVS